MKNRKNLKILLLTDRLSVGGAETHITSLYRALSSLGHSVTVVSCGGELAKDIRHVCIDLSSHSPIALIYGYFALRSLCLREKFDLIHAHARLPALVASFLAHKLEIPLLTTVHAKFSTDNLRRSLSVWGFRSVAVSEDLRFYLSQNYSIPSESITVIENGIDFKLYSNIAHPQKEKPFTLLFLSRLDSDCSLCAELLCKIAPRLLSRYKSIKIIIGGGGEKFNEIKQKTALINSALGADVLCATGEVSDVTELLSSADAFVGVSRCALEAVASSLPIIIAGNEGFLGRLTVKNFPLALASNFCARGATLPNADLLYDSICSLIDNFSSAKVEAQKLLNTAYARLDMSVIAPRYEKFYSSALAEYNQMKKKRAKTLLFGYYGFSNLGDDALLYSAINRARLEFGASIGALTRKPKKNANRFAIPCYNRNSPFSLFYRIFRCDRLIFGGGTLFQDGTSRRSLLYYLAILRLALFLKKDVLLYANGIGEINNENLRALLFSSLSRCSYIGLRDKNSFHLLHSALSPRSPIILENDLALSSAPSARSRIDFLLSISLKQKKNSFFVVCPHYRASRFDKFELELAIRKQKNLRLTPLFIPCSPDDLDICHSLSKKFGGAVLYPISFSDLLTLFPLAQSIISMRYHPLLVARIRNIPSLPIGTDPKISEFF